MCKALSRFASFKVETVYTFLKNGQHKKSTPVQNFFLNMVNYRHLGTVIISSHGFNNTQMLSECSQDA